MQIKSVTNQNFSGNLVYLAKTGEKYIDNAYNALPKSMLDAKKSIGDALRDEPFDVFISRGKLNRSFKVNASDGNKTTDSISVRLTSDKETNDNELKLPVAIFKSIANFKKL